MACSFRSMFERVQIGSAANRVPDESVIFHQPGRDLFYLVKLAGKPVAILPGDGNRQKNETAGNSYHLPHHTTR